MFSGGGAFFPPWATFWAEVLSLRGEAMLWGQGSRHGSRGARPGWLCWWVFTEVSTLGPTAHSNLVVIALNYSMTLAWKQGKFGKRRCRDRDMQGHGRVINLSSLPERKAMTETYIVCQ